MKLFNTENNLPTRKPTRLKEFDYSQSGYYFITICTDKRENILSNIVGEGFPLPQHTKQGKIVENIILSINQKYPTVSVNKFVIMPNHIHLILILENFGRGNPSPTVSAIIGWLKYCATKQINSHFGTAGNKIFQRSFHDHIIRNEKDYLEIWNYIDTNPQKWKEDCFYSN